MIKKERNIAQHKAAPRKMKNSTNFVMELSSADSRLVRRIKAGKSNGDKLKRNIPYN
jgi:hypothetical protein